MKTIIAILALASMCGCVGITGGRISGRKTGFDISKQLTPGMSLQETQAVLGDGGAPYPADTFVLNSEGVFAPTDPDQKGRVDMALREMKKLPEADQKRVRKIVTQSRGWGFFGFDDFYLYFDKEEKLVGHAMLHFN
jgi:hypothetical protein